MEKDNDKQEVEEKVEAKPEEKADGDTDNGDATKEIDNIDRANDAADRMERATERAKIENDRKEKLEINRTLGGKSEAGAVAPEKKEETPREYKDRVMRGEA